MGTLWWLIKSIFKLAILLVLLFLIWWVGYFFVKKDENRAYFANDTSIHIAPRAGWCSEEAHFLSFWTHIYHELSNEPLDTIVMHAFDCSEYSSNMDSTKLLYNSLITIPLDQPASESCKNQSSHPFAISGINNPLKYCSSRSANYPSGTSITLVQSIAPDKTIAYIMDYGLFQKKQQDVYAIIHETSQIK